MAHKLSTLLIKLISKEQGGFVHSRHIHENISLASKIMSDLHKKCTWVNVVLKIDMSKAFDKVNWSFLSQVLTRYGFSQEWRTLIQNRLCNNIFSVCIGGFTSRFFKSTRGLRQSDPLCPLLFILCEKPLSGGLSSLVNIGV